MNGTRISRNTSTDTRKPANRNTTPRNLPSWNSSVEPARLSESVIVGKNAPSAMRIVAGTREWSRPAMSSRNAPGRDANRFTTIATGAMNRLNRNWSPGWLGSSEYGSTRFLGMNTYVENTAPKRSDSAPGMFMTGVSSRR